MGKIISFKNFKIISINVLILFALLSPLVSASSQSYVNTRYIETSSKAVVGCFEANETWTKGTQGAMVADTVNFKDGVQGLKVTSWNNSASATTNVNTAVSNLNFTEKVSTLWLYVDNVTNLGGISLMMSTNSSYSIYKVMYLTKSHLITGWNAITLPNGNQSTSGGNDLWQYSGWSDNLLVGNVRLRVYSAFANVNVSVTFDNWIMFNNALSSGKVTFCFDDGWDSTFDTAKAMLDAYSFDASVNVITNYIGSNPNYLNWSEAQELVNSGWDFSSHSVNHYYLSSGGYSSSVLNYEVGQSKQHLLGNLTGNLGYRFWVEPYYEVNSTVQSVVDDYYSLGFSHAGQQQGLPANNVYGLQRFATSNTTTAASMIAAIKNATTYSNWLIFTLHVITANGSTAQDTFMPQTVLQSVLDYCNSNSVSVVTISDVYDSLITAPTYADVTHSSELAGSLTVINASWSDLGGFADGGYIIGSNVSGTMVNSSFTPFESGYFSVASLTNPLYDSTVCYQIWANNTANAWNTTGVLYYSTTLVSESISSGASSGGPYPSFPVPSEDEVFSTTSPTLFEGSIDSDQAATVIIIICFGLIIALVATTKTKSRSNSKRGAIIGDKKRPKQKPIF